MIPMPGPKIALILYQINIAVTDTQYVRSAEGKDIREMLSVRSIKAAVDPSNSKRLQMQFGESMAAGDIGLLTQSELYFVDERNGTANQRQSFVTYSGVVYRVTDYADWTEQCGCRVYLAKRHTSLTGALT